MLDEKDIPLDVPKDMRDEYKKNYEAITKGSGKLMLFAGDQKVEHLNDDFVGKDIPADDATPEHMFKIASQSNIGVFATQLGLIFRYGPHYDKVPYLVKINSKTNAAKDKDPFSGQLVSIEQVAEFKKNSGLNILGVGYTVYIGSEFESDMLTEAAQVVYEAHQNGLITVLWMYPRGKEVKDEKDPHLVAGAAGVAACLGTDFTKVNFPKGTAEEFREAILAAGKTKVVCAGGSSKDVKDFLQDIYDKIHISGAAGNATGRNIHQKPLKEAIGMTNAIYAITVEDKSADEAFGIYKASK